MKKPDRAYTIVYTLPGQSDIHRTVVVAPTSTEAVQNLMLRTGVLPSYNVFVGRQRCVRDEGGDVG